MRSRIAPVDERDLTGQVLGGKYRIEQALGRGGMGAVYVATQLELGRRVAVKVMLPSLARDRTSLARFRREAEIAAGIGHPNIVQVTDFGSDARGSYFVMDLLEGEPLSDVLRREGRLEPRRVVAIALQILSALGAVHARDVVHRDLKPPNVFLAKVVALGEMVKLLDFGVAKLSGPEHTRLTATGFAVGTVTYMAPEQLTGGAVDGRTDLYALGVIMYRCLAGRLPYEGSRELLPSMILSAPATPLRAFRPDVDPRLAAIVDRALEKLPGARYPSADAMAEALVALDRTEPGPVASPPSARAEVAEVVETRAAKHSAPPPPTASTRLERPAPDRRAPSPPAARRRRAAPILLAAAAAGAIAVAAAVIAVLALVTRTKDAASLPAAPPVALAPDAATTVPSPVTPIRIEPRVADASALPKDAGDETGETEPPEEIGDARSSAPSRPARTQREAPPASTASAEAPAARRIVSGGADYVEIGDVTYRVVLSNLDLAGMYSTVDDARPLNRLRMDVIDCLVASRYVPETGTELCWTVDISAGGGGRSFMPHPGGRDDGLARCAARAFHAMRLGPSRTGASGHARICFRVYPRRS